MNSLLNRTIQTLRGGVGQATRAGGRAAGQGAALGKRLINRGSGPKEDMDDATLARKVESEVFRDAGPEKGKVNVNVADGVVWLRGEVKNQTASKGIEAKARAISEVRDVENLLHLPKTPAPSRTRGGGKKTATKKAETKKAQSAKPTTRRFDRTTVEKPKSSPKEPLPKQAAKTGTGRQAAPLGAKDTEAPATTSADSLTGGTSPKPADGGGSEPTSGGTS